MNFYGAARDTFTLQALIDLELRAQGINATAVPAFAGPQLMTFVVRSAFGVDPRRVRRLADSIADKTGSESCVIHQTARGLVVQLPHSEEHRRTLSVPQLLQAISQQQVPVRPSAIPMGIDVLGRVAWLDLCDARTPHVGILGITGSGKSELMRWVALWLAWINRPETLRLLVISPKTTDFAPLRAARSLLHPPINSTAEAVRVLAWCVSEIDRRNDSSERSPAIVVLVDEIPDLIGEDGRIEGQLGRIAQIGRSLGIHLVAGSQRADQGSVGAMIYNLPARAVGKVGSGSFSYIVSGQAGSEVDKLLGRGDFLLTSPYSIRFQAPLIDGEWDKLKRGPEESLDLPISWEIPMRNTRAAERNINATELSADDMEELHAMFSEGDSIRAVQTRFNLGFARAKRLQAEWQAQHVEVEQWES